MKKILILILTVLLLLTGCKSDSNIDNQSRDEKQVEVQQAEVASVYPEHEPYGEGIGIYPGRVVWSFDPHSVAWDGSGYWWNEDNFNIKRIDNLVKNSLTKLTGANTEEKAWNQLFEYYNKEHGKSGGYKEEEKIAIKVNINGSGVFGDDSSGETNLSYTNPYLLKSLLVSLVEQAGVKPDKISVYDVSRLFPDYMISLCSEGDLNGIHFVGRDSAIPDESKKLSFSNDFDSTVSYLPTVVTEANYLINLANLKGHSYGITLTAKNHFGSFLNKNKINPPSEAQLHQWLTKTEMSIYSPLVDLMANENLGGKTILYILDGLIVAPGEGIEMTKDNTTWITEPFGKNFTSSVFMSQDPVAIDSVGADILAAETVVSEYNPAVLDSTNENYLHEAGLVSSAPSGTEYKNSEGKVSNLGVHEHWNNPDDKQYSRNLGKSNGIELIFSDLTSD